MLPVVLNYWAVLVAGVAAVAIGMAWYSPMLFGKQWMMLEGRDPSAMQGMKFPLQSMLIQLVASLVTAYVLAHFAYVWGVASAAEALKLGFWVWLGFYAAVGIGAVLWSGKKWAWYFLMEAHSLVSVLVMALIVGLWR